MYLIKKRSKIRLKMGEALLLLYKCLKGLFIVLVASQFGKFIEKFIFSDWSFLGFLLVLMAVDTILGFAVNFRKRTISSWGWAKVLWKLFLYTGLLITTHILRNYQVDGIGNMVFFWVDDVVYGAMIVREALSIFENIEIIKPGTIPFWFVKRLKVFKETGKIEPPEGFENNVDKRSIKEDLPAQP